MFACEHTHVAPDIMVVSKSIAGGFPGFSVILARKELLENLEILVHAGTFRGNHIGCAAAVANMTFIKEKKLPERAARLGTYVMKSLKDLQEESKIVGDVRGKGLFIGIELVKNKSTKEISGDLVKKVIMKMFRRGILVFSCGDKKSTIRLMPALTIPHELLDKSLQILRDAIKEVETEI
jgi:4-aminobutyrate aminotransferase-like enzyme